VVALRIELSATRVSDGFGHQPATTKSDFRSQASGNFSDTWRLRPETCSSRGPRSRTEILLFPKQACFQLHLYPINKVDELGVEPSSSDCKSKRRPVGKPVFRFQVPGFSKAMRVCLYPETCYLNPFSAARVGFEPDLSGLKNQRPHQKSNEPCCVCCFRFLSVFQ
jgi:hypothetical protein